MDPKEIPPKLIEQGIGIPMRFSPPQDEEGQPRQDVGELSGLMLEDARAMLTNTPSVNHRFITWWQPNDLERAKLAKGAPVRLTILGMTTLNPMSLEVGYDLEGILFSEGGSN